MGWRWLVGLGGGIVGLAMAGGFLVGAVDTHVPGGGLALGAAIALCSVGGAAALRPGGPSVWVALLAMVTIGLDFAMREVFIFVYDTNLQSAGVKVDSGGVRVLVVEVVIAAVPAIIGILGSIALLKLTRGPVTPPPLAVSQSPE